MTRAVRASGPQVMGNAFQMRLQLLGLMPKPCFQTIQASRILEQCGISGVRIPHPFVSADRLGPASERSLELQMGDGTAPSGSGQRVGLGSREPLMTQPVRRATPCVPSTRFPRFSCCHSNLATAHTCRGCPSSGWVSPAIQLASDGKISFSFPCHPPGTSLSPQGL